MSIFFSLKITQKGLKIIDTQYILEYNMLEKAVNIALGDKASLLGASHAVLDGVTNRNPTAFAMVGQRLVGVRIPQRGGNIPTAEQHLAVLLDGADAAELGASENL